MGEPREDDDTSALTYVAFVIFGLSSWVTANGLWVELPVLQRDVPEGTALATYMLVALQLANIFPLAFMLLNSDFSQGRAIFAILVCGVLSCALLAVFWRVQVRDPQANVPSNAIGGN